MSCTFLVGDGPPYEPSYKMVILCQDMVTFDKELIKVIKFGLSKGN